MKPSRPLSRAFERRSQFFRAKREAARTAAALRSLWKITIPFFRSPVAGTARLMLALLLALLFAVSGINVILSYVGRDLITALSERNAEGFYRQVGLSILAFGAATLAAVFYRYVEERLALKWREWMTEHLMKRYFLKRSYYLLRNRPDIDNPDQRIAEDVRNFTATSLSLFLIILNSSITVIAFVGVLASISWTLVTALVIYAGAGTVLTVLIGRRLVRLHYRQYNREANFRHGLIRVQDNAESIAFYRGENRERRDLLTRFGAVYQNTLELIGWNRRLAFFTTGYHFLAALIPTIIVAPLYLASQMEFGVVTQSAGAFAQVLAAMSVLITQFERVSAYVAGITRLERLWDALGGQTFAEEDDDPMITIEEGKTLRLVDLTVRPPKSPVVLVKKLSLSLPQRKGLLIMGQSGSGKSSILRTVAGLWNSGEGAIERLQLRDMMFLPQKPYMPVGTLRAQLVYPARDIGGRTKELHEILEQVNLEKIFDRRAGGFDREVDWSSVLSLGEQQRVSFARLLFHKPRLVFLDEATSALDEENERNLYTLLRSLKLSYVSVGHRSTLRQFHDQLLILRGNAEWEMAESVQSG